MVLFAKDILETDFLSLHMETNALEAARRMTEKRHGFVIVTDGSGTPVGIVTEWDFLARVIAEGRSPSDVTLGDIMTRGLVSVQAQDSIEKVAQVMTEKGVRRLLVVKDGKVLGVVTAATILRRLKDYVDRVTTAVAGFQGPWA